MSYNFTDFNKKISGIEDWVGKELSSIRTGQATITLLDSVMVDVYGTKTPINQSASISIEDPKTIRIVPWDKSVLQEIERGIAVADLGVSTAVDSDGVRVIFPDLTTESRERLVKQAKNKVEEAKVSIRNERSKTSNDIGAQQKVGDLSEDEAKRDKDEMQKIVDGSTGKLDGILINKEQEIMS